MSCSRLLFPGGRGRRSLSLPHQLPSASARPPSSASSSTLLSRLQQHQPVRGFGRGRPVQRFGHATVNNSLLFKVTWTMIWVPMFGLMIDWRYLKDELGINVPFLSKYMLHLQGVNPSHSSQAANPDGPSSLPDVMEEKQAEIHQFLLEEAKKRHNRRMAENNEPVDEAVEQERNKNFLDTLRQRTQVKAEEELAAKSPAFVAPLRDRLSRRRVQAEEARPVEAATDDDDDEELALSESEAEAEAALKGGKKGGLGFRNRKIMEYENRVRQYSTPDKIFRYFATYKVTDEKGHSEVMMSPEDFLRSITPGFQQPEQLGLDQFTNIGLDELVHLSPQLGLEESSIFYQLGAGGLISFSDYIFLLTVLSTSRRHFEIAFKMFDLNGDGNVDAKEFEVVTNLMKSQSSMGARHRDHQNTGSTFKGINSGLITYFFGESREGILTVDKFLSFQRHLQNEILALEFKRKSESNDNDRLKEKDFAELLIAYAGFATKKKTKMLKRVRKEYHQKGEDGTTKQQGITMADYLNFYQVLYSINDIDTALTFYHIAGAPIERSTMRHVARTVAGVDLSDHVIDVVFVLFDENGDGKLSNKEFVSVMKQRAMRGLEKPKDTGIGKVFAAITKCASDTKPAILGGLRKTE